MSTVKTQTNPARAAGNIGEAPHAGRTIGYARVSTDQQTTQLQLDALERAGCDNIAEEHGVSGTVAADRRRVLGLVLGWLEPGDTLVVWRLDRLGRSMIDLEQTVSALRKRGVGFRSLNEAIDTTTAAGKLMFQIMGSFAEFERNIIAERTKAGLQAVRDSGRKLGPAFKLTDLQLGAANGFLDVGKSTQWIAKKYGVSYHTLWRALKRYNAERDGNTVEHDNTVSKWDTQLGIEETAGRQQENLETPQHESLETVEEPFIAFSLPKHASVGDEEPVRHSVVTGEHPGYCDCKACMAKEEA